MTKGLILSAVAGLALMASVAVAQAPGGANTSYTLPAGARVTADKNTGALSVLMPREISDRAAGGSTRFDAWRKTPYAGKGPYPATRVEEASLPTHTLYYPADLAKAAKAVGGKFPVILWANGGCRNTSIEFTNFLGELASRGYFIVANGRNDVEFGLGGPAVPPDGKPPLTVRGGAIVIQGLDWLTKEAANKKSKYYNKVDLTKVAALGQSCGGGQVWEASKDTRIKAVAALNSSFPTKTAGFAPNTPAPTDAWTVEQLKIPAAYFIGGPGDQAYGRAQTSYAATPASATVIKANLPEMGHTGAYREPKAEWANAVAGWLDWQLKGDAKGKALFAGADCGLCKDSNWWLEAKNVN